MVSNMNPIILTTAFITILAILVALVPTTIYLLLRKNYNSPKKYLPIGMTNPGLYCFLISILSLFRNNGGYMNYISKNSMRNNSFFKKFVKSLNQLKTENTKDAKEFLNNLIRTIGSEGVDNSIIIDKKGFVEANCANEVLKKILDFIADTENFKNEIANYKNTNLLNFDDETQIFQIGNEIIGFLISITSANPKISDSIFLSDSEARLKKRDGVIITNLPEFLSFDFSLLESSIEIENFIKKSEDFNYELVSVLNFVGTYGNNPTETANRCYHYNTSIKRNGKWYLVDNNNVTEELTNDDGTLKKELKSGIVIYKKIKNNN